MRGDANLFGMQSVALEYLAFKGGHETAIFQMSTCFNVIACGVVMACKEGIMGRGWGGGCGSTDYYFNHHASSYINLYK